MSTNEFAGLSKRYYRIGEVSQIVGVQPHVLRYWESEFRSIRPEKSNKGQRVYSRRDVEKLLRVKDLLRNQGFTIAGARKRLRELTSASATEAVLPDGAEVGTPQPNAASGAKMLRRALVTIRNEITESLRKLDTEDERPDVS